MEIKPLEASDIEVRVGQVSEKRCSLLLYKDARCDMRVLDEVFGQENWCCRYHRLEDALVCSVGVYIESRGEWVFKEDVGVPSNMEATKGEFSDAFKRSCTKWGLGRELYTAPNITLFSKDFNISKTRQGKPACYDHFSITDFEVANGVITKLEIRNDDKNRIVYTFGKEPNSQPKPGRFTKIGELKKQALSLGIKEEGIRGYLESAFTNEDGTPKPMKNFNNAEIKAFEAYLEGLIHDKQELENN